MNVNIFLPKNGLGNSRNCRNYFNKLWEQNPRVYGAANGWGYAVYGAANGWGYTVYIFSIYVLVYIWTLISIYECILRVHVNNCERKDDWQTTRFNTIFINTAVLLLLLLYYYYYSYVIYTTALLVLIQLYYNSYCYITSTTVNNTVTILWQLLLYDHHHY